MTLASMNSLAGPIEISSWSPHGIFFVITKSGDKKLEYYIYRDTGFRFFLLNTWEYFFHGVDGFVRIFFQVKVEVKMFKKYILGSRSPALYQIISEYLAFFSRFYHVVK